MCSICADICEACAAECSKHDNPHCRECADTCTQCAEACRKLLIA
ncbi:four-helix bundle copper-binding protein [Chitinophaga rhizophila]|nr:four-helix bundle copper-binding protein [Chitinophaga rhizophila]